MPLEHKLWKNLEEVKSLNIGGLPVEHHISNEKDCHFIISVLKYYNFTLLDLNSMIQEFGSEIVSLKKGSFL